MQLTIRNLSLPLRHTFTISRGSTEIQKNILVELREEGFSGYGEGAPLHIYPSITVATMRADLEAARPLIESQPLDHPDAFWDRLFPLLGKNRFALCAVDQAAHDLWGKKLGQPVWKLWGLDLDRLPFSNYTIGLDTMDKMILKLREFEGWPIYKIKLGTKDDLSIVRELRRHTSAVFRVDANCAWTVEQTLSLAPVLKALGVEFIEQPLPLGDWEGMRRLHGQCALPLMADESCQVEDDVPRCAGHFHGINIKLTKAGGLTPARRMIARARQLGLKVMVGCMVESTVGISAIAQLLPLLDYVDMDGATLIAQDVATGVRLEQGRAIYPRENGNGVRLTQAATAFPL